AKEIVEPTIVPRRGHWLVTPLAAPGKSVRTCVPRALFALPGLEGEVAIDPAGAHAQVELLVEGRKADASRSSAVLAFDAIATASALRLTADHTRIERDDAQTDVLLAIDAAVVLACESVARRLAGHEPSK